VKFLEFLVEAKKKSFWNNRVICFRGAMAGADGVPLLFFRHLFEHLKEKEVASVLPLRVSTTTELWKTLQQSFLGETAFYWLGAVADTIKKGKKGVAPDLVDLLSMYRGPHSIAFFVSADQTLSLSVQKRMVVVDLQANFMVHDIVKLFSFFGASLSSPKKALLKELLPTPDRFSGGVTMSLDLICMLLSYLSVTSPRYVTELKKSLGAIVEPELSLYELSRSFFTMQEKKFFAMWVERQDEYSVPFWVSYWSEQLWRAYYVVTFLKQNNFPAARRFAYRLPSSFIKSDWRRCSLEKLKAAFVMLYDIDYAFKKGSTFCSFDLFFSSYFSRCQDQGSLGLQQRVPRSFSEGGPSGKGTISTLGR